jgi:hypothetical protein
MSPMRPIESTWHFAMRMLTMQLLYALLLCYQCVVTLTGASTENGGDEGHDNSTVPKVNSYKQG